MNLKEELYKACKEHIEKREETITKTIRSHQNALQSETKSSAGDKHETGRAMLQLEMEKAGQQLSEVDQMKTILSKVDYTTSSNIVHLGSIVKTNKAKYFISISAGQIKIENTIYYAISLASPIGKLLLGKQKGDSFLLHNNTITITEVL